jgi:hypothetical protein
MVSSGEIRARRILLHVILAKYLPIKPACVLPLRVMSFSFAILELLYNI